MRLATLIVGVLLGVVVIFLSLIGMVANVDTVQFGGDDAWAGEMIWLLMALWALGVTFVMVWPLIATLAFATAAVLALVTIVRSDGQTATYGSSMVVWVVLSLWVGTTAFLEWRDTRKVAVRRRARIMHADR